MPSPSASSTSSDYQGCPVRLNITLESVNWDSILHTVRDKLGATSARWGKQKWGGFNLVRFLHLDHDEVVVRLPLYPDPTRVGPMTPEIMQRNIRKMTSMIASMEYVTTYTSIPVPRVIYSCLGGPELDEVGSPYVVISKVEGRMLFFFWEDMPDEQRDMVLEQLIEILLELSTHRFDKIGSLFRTDEGGWSIEPLPSDSDGFGDDPRVTYTSGTDRYIDVVNARLRKLEHNRFGEYYNEIEYPQYWLMRSLIPCLYDNLLDATGFPLMHGDFDVQNILVTDVDTRPRITAVVDWDNAGTICTSSFSQYPSLIVNHPYWEKYSPIRERNFRDQVSFNLLLEKAERRKFPDAAPRLSGAFANCRALYLFEQSLNEDLHNSVFPHLVDYVFATEQDWVSFKIRLTTNTLKGVIERFMEEVDAVVEARDILGEEVNLPVDDVVSREQFTAIVRKYQDRLPADGQAMSWLRKQTS